MKAPCPAFYFEPARHVGIPAVLVRPCIVLVIFPTKQFAIIELASLQVSGRCTKWVPFDDLVTTAEKAVEEAARRIKLLPVPVVKAAAAVELAGAGPGAGAPLK